MCDLVFVGICFTHAPASAGSPIFGFAQFLSAFSLMVLVFSQTDQQYRFRVAVAPLPIVRVIFGLAVGVGWVALISDLWFQNGWLAPAFGVSQSEIQAVLGGTLFCALLLWTWFAFIRPPKFGRSNAQRYFLVMRNALLRGSETQLPAIAGELGDSAKNIVNFAAAGKVEKAAAVRAGKAKPGPEDYAHDLLVMLGDKRFCRYVVKAAPGTAVAFMYSAAAVPNKRSLPMGVFSMHLTEAALRNADSNMYQEYGVWNGLFGEHKPFMRALFGNFELVEALSHYGVGPLDLDYEFQRTLTPKQFDLYCGAVELTFASFISGGVSRGGFACLSRAFNQLQSCVTGIYTLNGSDKLASSDEYDKLKSAVALFRVCIRQLNEAGDLGRVPIRNRGRNDIFDELADFAFELIGSGAYVRSPPMTAWHVQHNALWGALLRDEGPACTIVRKKLFRLLYAEVLQMGSAPDFQGANFRGAAILGFLLTVMGLKVPSRKGFRADEYPIHKVIRDWTVRNYAALAKKYPEVAEHALTARMAYEPAKTRISYTFERFISDKAAVDYLDLASAPKRGGRRRVPRPG
jgi:hypothetical protein